jgi:hypothetical protein
MAPGRFSAAIAIAKEGRIDQQVEDDNFKLLGRYLTKSPAPRGFSFALVFNIFLILYGIME